MLKDDSLLTRTCITQNGEDVYTFDYFSQFGTSFLSYLSYPSFSISMPILTTITVFGEASQYLTLDAVYLCVLSPCNSTLPVPGGNILVPGHVFVTHTTTASMSSEFDFTWPAENCLYQADGVGCSTDFAPHTRQTLTIQMFTTSHGETVHIDHWDSVLWRGSQLTVRCPRTVSQSFCSLTACVSPRWFRME